MPAAKNSSFIKNVRKTPGFGFTAELNELVERHGADSPDRSGRVIRAFVLTDKES